MDGIDTTSTSADTPSIDVGALFGSVGNAVSGVANAVLGFKTAEVKIEGQQAALNLQNVQTQTALTLGQIQAQSAIAQAQYGVQKQALVNQLGSQSLQSQIAGNPIAGLDMNHIMLLLTVAGVILAVMQYKKGRG